MGTLGKAMIAERNANNYDMWRFLAASMVIVNHSFALSGSTFEPLAWLSQNCTLGMLGVEIFFILSGFLITGSWYSCEKLLHFFQKRFLRIYPAYAIVILATVFMLCPLLTTIPLNQYYSHPYTRGYLMNLLLGTIHYNLPGVFEKNLYPHAVNGSIWTLPLEVADYFLVALFGATGLLKRKWFLPAFLLLVLILYFNSDPDNLTLFLWIPVHRFFELSIFFMMGSLFYIHRDKIPLSLDLFVFTLVLYFIGFRNSAGPFIRFITLPYIVLYTASIRNSITNNWGRFGDFSYGMYIYAFPVQQSIVYFSANNINWYRLFACSFPITLILAFLSWHLIEKNALRLKRLDVSGALVSAFRKLIFVTNT
jgi:peptidoglycan/LPS O-acetylase OafA/YrhL